MDQNIAAENLLGVSRPLVYLDMGKSSIVLKPGHETNTRFVGIGGPSNLSVTTHA